MATDPPADLQLDPINGEPRSLAQWVTNFHLAVVVVDPFTYESAWILDEAGRILTEYSAADVRVGWVVTGTKVQAREFLGPWSESLLTFADPDRTFSSALSLETLPAFVHVNTAAKVETAAEGWEPLEWRKVAERLSTILSWSRPTIPGLGAPAAFGGSPAAG